MKGEQHLVVKEKDIFTILKRGVTYKKTLKQP